MVDKIHLKSLRNSEFSQFLNDILKIVFRNDPAALKVIEEYGKLDNASKEVESLFKVQKKLDGTEELVALDNRRDKAATGIVSFVQSHLNHFDESKQQHARILFEHLERYGGASIARENYVSETAIIKNLVNDWITKADLKVAIEGLQLTEWRDELESANNAFHEKYIDRAEKMGEASPATLYDKRTEATQHYFDLRDHIEAFSVIKKGADPYGKTIKQLNAVIGQYNTLLNARKARKDQNGEGETPDLEDTAE